jgi:hypothetical protein
MATAIQSTASSRRVRHRPALIPAAALGLLGAASRLPEPCAGVTASLSKTTKPTAPKYASLDRGWNAAPMLADPQQAEEVQAMITALDRLARLGDSLFVGPQDEPNNADAKNDSEDGTDRRPKVARVPPSVCSARHIFAP